MIQQGPGPANHLLGKVRAGEPALGLWITLESPSITEMAVMSGLDWICVDLEHGHLGWETTQNHLRATAHSKTTPLVRIPELRRSYVQRALDIGAQGIVVPQVTSANDVRTAVRYALFHPNGSRGIGGERGLKWTLPEPSVLGALNEQTMVIPIIETPEGYSAIEDIAAVDGVKALMVGPADLCASLGRPGEWNIPEVEEALRRINDVARSHDIPTMILARGTIEDARDRINEGFGIIGIGSDSQAILQFLQGRAEAIRAEELRR